jgi:hypothetical protein
MPVHEQRRDQAKTGQLQVMPATIVLAQAAI